VSTTPRKILLIYDCLYPASLGGIEHRNFCLAEALATRGHQVTLAGWGEPPSPPLHPNIHVINLPFRRELHNKHGKRILPPTILFALAMLRLDLWRFDIIETANIPYLHILPLALRCALIGKPLIVTWYEFFGRYWYDYSRPLPARLFSAMEKMVLAVGKRRWVNSLHTLRRLEPALPPNAPPPDLLYNGVWLEKIRQVQLRPSLAAPQLLYAGRLIPEKRLDLLLQAVARLPAPPPGQIQLGLVGDGPHRRNLEQLSNDLGLQHRVKFYGRLPDIEDMWHLLVHSKLAVQPSQREGFGMFPLEALALGKPVIFCASPDNAIGEIVRDGQEGLCAEPTPEALAAAINRLLNNTTDYQAMADRAITRAAEFDWPMIAMRAESLLDTILAPN
jgi:glycosyltransferase involved in cell wall biosynthesis